MSSTTSPVITPVFNIAGRHYDEIVIAYDMFLTALIKVEVLNETQFREFCERLKVSGFEPDQEQLIYTFLEAMRKG